jgi:3-deoxy-manno-octulosonate cytidylyltransferase (CMP-KDO synthetase)
MLGDKTLIEHTLHAAERAGASDVIVACDDPRIVDTVEVAGGRAMLTSPDHRSGTDRLAEVAAREGWSEDTIVVNLQGDEPGIDPKLLHLVAGALADHANAGIATVATPIRAADELFDPNVVKVVCDQTGMASYFSRAPIPWVRGRFALQTPVSKLPDDVTFLRHLGLYAYRVATLHALARAEPSMAERAESLEQLRALALGIGIHVSVIAEAPHVGVDTEDDLRRVERLLRSAPR